MRNNGHAMEQFLASVEQRAFRMAQIATGNTEDALDIVQDAMLSLVRRYGKKPEAEWKPLFFRILQNRIRDWYRRNAIRNWRHQWLRRRGKSDEEDADDQMTTLADPASRSPADQLIVKDSVAALELALHKLPRRQQQTFLLRAWEGMSVKETAGAMGCSEGTVKTQYSRAIHTLRGMLEDWG